MPELPEVTQSFTAETAGYVRGIEEMIAETERLVKSIQGAVAATAELQAAIDALHGKDITIRINEAADAHTNLASQMAGVVSEGDQLKTVLGDISADAHTTSTVLRTMNDSLQAVQKNTADASLDLMLANQQLAEIKDSFDSAARAAYAFAAASLKARESADAGAAGGRGGGGRGGGWWWTALNAFQIPLFGGAGVFGIMKIVSALHLVVDAVAEVAAVLIPAGLAFGAWAAASYPSIDGIKDHLTAVYDVTKATGQAIPPLSGAFNQVARAVQPSVYSVFGAALSVINSRIGEFRSLATGVGGVIQQIAARSAAALNSAGVSQFMRNAVGDFRVLGNIVGNVFGTIGNLLKSLPGYAQPLFQAIQGITGALEWLTASGAVQDILRIGLAFHGAVLWAGIATTAVLGLGRAFIALAKTSIGAAIIGFAGFIADVITITLTEGIATGATYAFSTALATLNANPLMWVALAAGALVGLIVVFSRVKTAAQSFGDSLQNAINKQTTIAGVMGTTAAAVGQVDDKLRAARQTLADTSKVSVNLHTGVMGVNQAYYAQKEAVSQLVDQQTRFNHELMQEQARVGAMQHTFGGVTQALGYFNLAGIKASDLANANAHQWALDIQQMQDLKLSYQAMGITAGVLGNDIRAVTLNTEQQDSKVQTLNQGWQNFISDVIGGEQAFTTFQTQLLGVYQAAGSTATQMNISGGAVRLTTRDITVAGVAASKAASMMGGLSTKALQVRSAFYQTVSAGSQLLQNLQTQVTLTGGASRATNLLTQSGKALVAELIPLTSHNAAARSAVYALAQEAGYSGVNSMKALAHWTGNMGAAKAARELNSATGSLTKMVSNLGQDAKNLATTMQSVTNQMLVQQADILTNLEPKIATYLGYLKKYGPDSSITIAALNNVNQAQQQANQLAQEGASRMPSLTGHVLDLAHAYANSHGPGHQMIQDMQDILNRAPKAGSDINSLATAVMNQGVKAAQQSSARQALIKDLEKTGMNAHAATRLVNDLILMLGRIPHRELVDIFMNGAGHYTISGAASFGYSGAASQAASRAGQFAGGSLTGTQTKHGRAEGGYISGPGSHTSDSIPARLSNGEYVMRAAAVAHYGKGMMDAINAKHFAAGGLVETGNRAVLSGRYAVDMFRTFQGDMISSMVGAMRSTMSAAQAAAMAAVAVGSYGGGSVANYVQAQAARMGWTGYQWQALYNVLMRESGLNPYAVNPTSGAAGIFQSMGHGAVPLGNVAAQTAWGLQYIKSRYGSPAAAWAHEVAYGWYDKGGLLMPGLTLAFNGTGRPEHVVSGDSHPQVIHTHVYLNDTQVAEAIGPAIRKEQWQYDWRNSAQATYLKPR